MTAYINDRFVTGEEATLHVSDLSVQRGYAVFDFFRTIKGIPLFLVDHLDRFYSSAKGFHLEIRKSREEIKNIIFELISRSSIEEAGIRMTLTGGYSTDTYTPAETNLIITCNPVKTASANDFEKGIAAITYEYQRDLPQIKSINYQHAVWLQPLLKEKKADDVIYYKNNIITEFPRSNIFIVTPDGILATPLHNVLAGITRKHIIALSANIESAEIRDISKEELLSASEVFLTSTTRKIMPVLAIDGKPVGDGKPGTVTEKLYRCFLQLEKDSTHLVSR